MLIDNPSLLTVAGSILTIKARHDSYPRAAFGPSAFPTALDTFLKAVVTYNLGHSSSNADNTYP